MHRVVWKANKTTTSVLDTFGRIDDATNCMTFPRGMSARREVFPKQSAALLHGRDVSEGAHPAQENEKSPSPHSKADVLWNPKVLFAGKAQQSPGTGKICKIFCGKRERGRHRTSTIWGIADAANYVAFERAVNSRTSKLRNNASRSGHHFRREHGAEE